MMPFSALRRSLAIVLTALLLLALPALLRADGFIIVHSGPVIARHFAFAPLEVTYHHVAIDIDDPIANTSVDEEFYNPNPQQLECEYVFPLPAGAHIDKFKMDIDGKMVDAELLSADKAKELFEKVLRESRDPALLEYVGRDAFRVKIFPIPANGKKRIELSYTELVKNDSGTSEYVYPLNTEKFSARPLKDVSIRISLTGKEPLKAIYSPSHNVEIKRQGDKHAIIGYEEHNVRPDIDFKLIYSHEAKEVGLNLLTYRAAGDDGYFLLLGSVGAEINLAEVQPKDIVFILDTSGSMSGPKIDQAKKALIFCLGNLNDTDRFEVLRFSTEVEPLFNDLVFANKNNLSQATTFVDKLKAMGATAIDDVLQKALALRDKRPAADVCRPYVVIFLTDGQPTIGETREDAIVDKVAKTGKGITRIFSFGIGDDVNTHLLDRLSAETRAVSQYVGSREDMEIKVSNFFTKIKEPVLSDVQVAISGPDIKTSEIYPSALPDLFKGQSLVVFGRYSGHGPGIVKLTGVLNGQKKEFGSAVNFTAEDASRGYIPQLWATRRVGWLLDEIRMHGENKELRDEVTRLARQFGIVTPYTSYLIMEDEKSRHVPVAAQNLREFSADAPVASAARDAYKSLDNEARSEASRSGGQAVANAVNFGDYRNVENLSQKQEQGQQNAGGGWAMGKAATHAPALYDNTGNPPPAAQPSFGYRQAQNYAQQARVVQGRAFYQNANIWTDSTIQANADAVRKQIQFNSDDYFSLLKKHPDAVQWLALGSDVDVMLDGVVYEIRP